MRRACQYFPMEGRACGRQRYIEGPLPSTPGNYFFFPFLLFLSFLDFLLFFAMCITPLPGSAGQRNVDRMSTYH
jgi:hypothetical protein